MTEELFEVVDEHDKPTGQKVTKKEAHEKMFIHRCVAVFVLNKAGELYVQEHKNSNGRLDHTVGGHVDSGEDYKTAAIRETAEEIGLEDVGLNEVATSYLSYEKTCTHMFGIYECEAPDEWKFTPNEEVDVIYPMKLEDIVTKMNIQPEEFTGGFINTMKKYLEIKKLPLKIKVNLQPRAYSSEL